MPHPLSILSVTNIYPTARHPTLGVFVEQQVKGLREIGLKVEVLYVDRTGQGMGAYFRMRQPLSEAVRQVSPALLHVMYGGVMADRVTRWNSRCPTIVSFHGSDLLGENFSGRWRKWISHYGVRCSRRAAGRAQGIVVVSRRLRQALPAGLDESKVRVIPCGIDPERFKPMDQPACQRQLGWLDRSFHVLFPSNSGDKVKRPALAAAAVAALRAAGVPAELHYMRGVPILVFERKQLRSGAPPVITIWKGASLDHRLEGPAPLSVPLPEGGRIVWLLNPRTEFYSLASANFPLTAAGPIYYTDLPAESGSKLLGEYGLEW